MDITGATPTLSVGNNDGFGGGQGVFRMPQSYTFNAGPGPFGAQPLPFPAGTIA